MSRSGGPVPRRWGMLPYDDVVTGTNQAPADALTRAVLTAPLWLPPRRSSTRGIAAAIGTSQSRVARLLRGYATDSPAAAELSTLIGREHLTITGLLVSGSGSGSGSHILLESVGGLRVHDYAPVSGRNRLRVRALLAADVVRQDVEALPLPASKEPALPASKEQASFRARVERAAQAGGATVLTSATAPVLADRVGRARVLRCASSREWQGLFTPLCALAEPLVDETLVELEQRLRRWYQHPEHPFLWLAESLSPGGAPDRPSSPSVTVAPGGTSATEARAQLHETEDALLRDIQAGLGDGTFGIGDDISVRVLADRLGMGRSRVRRAIQSLGEEGLVTVTGEAGITVRLPSASDVVEMYAARRALGSIAVRAASRRSDLDAGELEALVAALDRSVRVDDRVGMQRFDSEFQVALAHASGLSKIPAMLDSFTKQLVMFITLLGVQYNYPADRMLAQDARLLAAIRARDQEAAVRAWQEKIDAGARYMLGQVRLLSSTR